VHTRRPPVSVVFQVLGALAVLAAFIAVQRGVIDARSGPYLILNLVGSALLAWLALIGHQWGFLLLEGTWAAVSLAGLRTRTASDAARRARGEQLRSGGT
jgi:hypothetical protein